MSSSKPQKLIGTVIATRYRLQEILGSGTMGSVFRAEHVHMKKQVAVKILHATHVKDPEVVERFQREAQAAANIDHPNVCTATDFGRHDDHTYFLVMEYLKGQSLHDAIKSGEPFSEIRTVKIVKEICAALSRAHELGVVHRDLKPENILLVEKDGDPDFVKITDFGVAQVRLFKDAARLTQAGVVYGSPLYMSPEQAGGKEVDHRADLYSVGIMLYELLSDTLPFYAKSLTVVLNMHLSDPPRPFREANPFRRVDPRLEEITLKLLAKKREERFQSAQEIWNALDEVEKDLSSSKKAPSERAKPKEESEGGLFRSALVSIAVILGAIGIVWGAWTMVDLKSIGNNNASNKGTVANMPTDGMDAPRAEYAATKAMAAALKMKKDDPVGSIDAIGQIVAKEPQNPHARFFLGHAHVELGEWPDGFAEYRTAIQLEPKYGVDRELLDDVMARFESGKAAEAKEAIDFITNHLKSGANQRLAALAEHHRSRKVRKRALKLLKDTGEMANLEEWAQLTIELRHASGCESNKKVIIRIGELGDPRTLAALQRFDALPKDRCDGKDCWECLRTDLREAIRKLKEREAMPSVSGQ